MKLNAIRIASVWIPCSKQMPPDYKNVLVYLLNKNGGPIYRVDWPISGRFTFKSSGETPLFWMELPKPPKS